MNIILCGPPLAGKTTLGQKAAQQLRWQFLDTDRILEKCYAEDRFPMTYREIYQKEGEEVFRRYESRAIMSLHDCKKCVIALGGGSLNKVENVQMLKTLGSILYLKTSLETLQERLLAGLLPSYLEKEKDPVKAYQELIRERCSIYEKCADRIIVTDSLSQDQIVASICGCRSV